MYRNQCVRALPVTYSGSRNNTEAPKYLSRIGSESPTPKPKETRLSRTINHSRKTTGSSTKRSKASSFRLRSIKASKARRERLSGISKVLVATNFLYTIYKGVAEEDSLAEEANLEVELEGTTKKGNGTALVPEVRLYIPITLGNGCEIYTDLDTGAEYNIVSKEFTIKNKLLAIPFSSLTLKGVALDRLRTYSTEKIVKRPYIGIDRDLRLEGSPILLLRTFINKFDVIL
ncbi:hypothetical protein N7489_010949 [Penicillium chrysogenum]|uniref:uncharacterized protein n=1 Tax=Penicillium chrysogenum TaxID=5076 RepID=UPI0024DF16AE|nr:uncharacterized protein N7489_010949 [Penicillium chrysogenum]KAJ5230241.1 hypothetical protein N7489_010949 [Penicillium chrysogenum]